MQAQQPEVEAVRNALRALGPRKSRALALKLGLVPETISKFRRGHISEPGATKFAILKAALFPKSRKVAKPSADTGERRRSTDRPEGN